MATKYCSAAKWRDVPNPDIISSSDRTMKSNVALLMFSLLLLPIKANGQSPDDQVVGPTPVGRWRDGYIWRGGKVSDPDWRTFKMEDGATFVIDMKSIVNISRTDQIIRVIAYLVQEEQFNSKKLDLIGIRLQK